MFRRFFNNCQYCRQKDEQIQELIKKNRQKIFKITLQKVEEIVKVSNTCKGFCAEFDDEFEDKEWLQNIYSEFGKIIIFVDRATPHCSKITREFLDANKGTIRLEYFPVGSPEFDAVEECWRQGKYHILSTYYSTFDFLKDTISYYYRTTRFNLDIVKYLMRIID